jgi:bifunctional non-homologous end joining protein LigD
VPKGDAWLHEVKFDGYRVQVHKLGRKVWLFTRNGYDWTDRFPQLASELAALPACIIDAELVATDQTGKINFRTLRRSLTKRQEGNLALWAFDLLYARGRDIGGLPYIKRKARLARMVASASVDALRHPEHFDDGDRLLTECGKRGLEGVVSKRRDSPYRTGKQTRRIEVKCQTWREASAPWWRSGTPI